jgi:hypothetical protein
MEEWLSLKPTNYFTGALWASVALGVAAMGFGNLGLVLICIGGVLASVGEWMHYRRRSMPFGGGLGVPVGTYYQDIRVPHTPGDVLIWAGAVVGLIGLAGVIRQLFFQ